MKTSMVKCVCVFLCECECVCGDSRLLNSNSHHSISPPLSLCRRLYRDNSVYFDSVSSESWLPFLESTSI